MTSPLHPLGLPEKWHGTAGGYCNHACRCARCTEAWRIRMRLYQRRRRARGVCVECNTPSVKARCDKHRALHNAVTARYQARKRAEATHV